MHDLCRKCGSNGSFMVNVQKIIWTNGLINLVVNCVYIQGFVRTCKKDIEYLPNNHRFCEGCFSMYKKYI